jgi:Leucine-rich repeat (LRR) protein
MLSLEILNLATCDLKGTLPQSFRNLSHLASLDLGYNNINGSLTEFLYPLATKEKNPLQVLQLSQNQLEGSLPDFFTRFPFLRDLSISNNKLSGPFPDNFAQLSPSLVNLELYNNQLTGPLPNLTLFSALESLDLSNNNLEDTIPEAHLSNLSKLKDLDLSSNSLSFNISFDWNAPFKLDRIILQNCTLGPHFPNWIKSQHTFSWFDISNAGISDTIPLWFWDLSPNLRNLNMSYNQMEGMLPDLSVNFPDIDWVDLSYNRLQGLIPPIPKNLKLLDLTHNMLTGSLSFICSSSYIILLELHLSDNRLSGELPADCLHIIGNIKTLNLANNNLSGNIPTSIGLLNELTILQLRDNNLIGQLPSSLMNNTYLRLLDLSKNNLSGEVPIWIGTHLKRLIVLSLSGNEFSGSIPPQICHLENAQVLDFSKNNLTGSIPHCIHNITSLVETEISNGQLHFFYGNGDLDNINKFANAVVQWKGVAAEYKKTLELLKLIDLSSNRLIGNIPEDFASLKGLISLNLSSNNLTGHIIPKIGQMTNLESLDLSRNHLSGEIPSSLASLTFLSVLDLSNNSLQGGIPTSTQIQSFDPSKFAGNEQLCGLPLPNKCRGIDYVPAGRNDDNESYAVDDDKFPKLGLYVSVVLGFATGFWGFICPIMLRRTRRHSYYRMLSNITDWIYVRTILNMAKLQRKFYS